MNRQTIALLCVFLSACAHQPEPPVVAQLPIESDQVCSEKWSGSLLLADEQAVRKKYSCEKNALPYLRIESQAVSPQNQRLVKNLSIASSFHSVIPTHQGTARAT